MATLVHGVDFQRAVLRLMMLDAGFCGKAAAFLKESYFTGELSWFFRKIKNYYEDFKRPMSSAELQTEIFKHGDPAEIRKYESERQIIVAVDIAADKNLSPDYIKRELTGFIRANIFVGSYQEAAQIYNSGNKQSAFEFTKDRLDDLLLVDFEREQTIDCGDYKTVLSEAAAQRTKAIPTGIHGIDQAMGGGLLPQTWTTFLGGSNVGKCLSEGSLVPTDRGLIKISETLPGDRVFGIDGTRKVLAVHKNGKKPVKKMVLKNGLSIESTQDHVHVAMSDGGRVEKKLADIKVGDWIVVPSGGWTGKKEIDPEIAWLLGFTFGDGSYFNVRGSRQLSWFVSFEPFQKKIIRILKKHGCQNPRIYPRGEGASIHSNTRFADLLEEYGLRTGTGLKKKFINTWEWSEESVGWFIAGIMDADGTLNFSGTHFSLALHHEAVFEIQQILLRLGIFSSSRTRLKTIRLPKKTIKNYKVFSLTVSGENTHRFFKKIPISNKWKDRRFFLRPKKGGQDHVFVTPEIRNEVRKNKVFEGDRQKGKRIRNSVCLRSHLQKMGISFEQDFFISQVVSIRSAGVKETYDLSVDRDNLFVAGGILTHNSMLCPNLAYSAVMAGKKVFITVHEDEINPTLIRYFSRFTGISMDRLTLPESMRTPAEEAALAGVSALIKDRIKLRFMYGNECFIERLQDVVYQQHDQWQFDLYLCDYGQCLKSRAFKNIDNTYSVQEFIYSELKQMCLELNIAGAGGAQVNRQGHRVGRAGSDFLRMTDVGDCIARGTLVLTRSGYKPIETISEGEMVLTHLGNWKRVAKVYNRGIKPTIKMKFDGMPSLRCTSNHPIWTVEKRIWGGKRTEKTPPHWKEAGDLLSEKRHRNRALIPRPSFGEEKNPFIYFRKLIPEWEALHGKTGPAFKGKWEDGFFVDEKIAYVFGLFLAEGCLKFSGDVPDGILFTFHSNETSFADEALGEIQRVFGLLGRNRKHPIHNSQNVEFYSKPLTLLFQALFGRYSHGKKIPDFLWDAGPEIVKSFLRGVQDGDGDSRSPGMDLRLHNPILVANLSALSFSVNGKDYFLTDSQTRPGRGLCLNKTVKPSRWFREKKGEGVSHGDMRNGYLEKSLIKTVRDNLEVETWDLAVEDDHSFVVDGGFAVHNSWGIAKKSSNVITMNRSAEDMVNNRITFLLDKVRHGRCPVAIQCVTDYSRAIVYDQDPINQVEISVTDGPSASDARDS